MNNFEVPKALDCPRIVFVAVGVELELLGRWRHNIQQMREVEFDRSGIGPTQLLFQFIPLPELPLRHLPTPSFLTVGEAVEEMRALPSGEVKARRVVLAELEALEAVGSEGLGQGAAGTVKLVVQKTMASQSPSHSGNGLGRHLKLAGDLADARASEQAVEYWP